MSRPDEPPSTVDSTPVLRFQIEFGRDIFVAVGKWEGLEAHSTAPHIAAGAKTKGHDRQPGDSREEAILTVAVKSETAWRMETLLRQDVL